jgi:Phosphotransferase enzyme family
MPQNIDQKSPARLLSGGRQTPGVVQIGSTVRRPASHRSEFVARVLNYLERHAFNGAPRYLGRDEQDKDIFSHVPGDVPRDLGEFSAAQLTQAARLLRSLHDATMGFADMGLDEVVCHGDPSPCNCVFLDGVPYAFIDFDDAYIGHRDLDLGYAAWLWLDIGNSELLPEVQAGRLERFFDGYGGTHQLAPATAVISAQERHLAKDTLPPAVREWTEDCLRWTREHLL